jgi:probable O-glycosylation ligase (exosortase A-associated)
LPELALGSPFGRFAEPRWSLAFVGILLYLVIEYTRLPVMFPFLLEFHVAKFAAGIALVGFAFAAQERSSVRSEGRSLDFGVLAFVLISLVSTVLARNAEMAWSAFTDIFRWAVIYFLVSRIVTSRWRIHVFLGLLLLLNLKLAQFQVRDYFYQKAWGRSDEFLARGVGAGSVGFFANSNDFGVAMCVVWPLAGILIFGESKKYLRLFMLISFAVFTGSLLLSGSRGALAGAAATALVAFLANPRKLIGPVMIVVLLLGVRYLLPQANMERIRTATDASRDANVATRLNLWKMGVRMYADNPVWGVGPGNYRSEFLRYDPSRGDPRFVLAPHSIYVQALSELGTFGALALIWLCVKAVRLNLRTGRRSHVEGKGKQPLEWYFAHGLNLALVGFLASGAFLTVLYYPHFWFLIAMTVGLSVATLRRQEAAQVERASPPVARTPSPLPVPAPLQPGDAYCRNLWIS